MARPNFTQCAMDYMQNATAQQLYGWKGEVIGISSNNVSQISTEGCRQLCGTGADYYPWLLASNTITTWILPVVGILLQAPFDSNAFWRTVLAIARWIGSPMASLAYILWNIKVSAKCALMVDMSTRCDEQIPDQKSDFGSIRDSFYILMTMNQYTMRRSEALNKEAEGLLRIVLFSKDLNLGGKYGKEKRLNKVRQDLARKFRTARRRGTVPVFVSTGWFLFSLGISIQASFGEMGQNATAHDLALGLLLAWLPVLILCSIVDRNPVAADDIRRKLNKLIETVCEALQDDEIREEFISTFKGKPECKRMEAWVRRISQQSEYMQNFFVDFAGQGRVRWHYGAAHPILSDIENSYITSHGRGWLTNEAEARMHLVLGSVDEGLLWFDMRELWQIGSGVLIVGGTCFGAFILSFYTPTVGLGCRSGGYVIFCVICVVLLTLELLVWWIASPVRPEQPHWIRRSITHIQAQPTVVRIEEKALNVLQRAKKGAKDFRNRVQNSFGGARLRGLGISPSSNQAMEASVRHQKEPQPSWALQQWMENCFFRPAEVVNLTWLGYIVLAQTFGSYRTCDCMTSTWGNYGGYMDFQQSDRTNSPWVRWYWSAGTAIGTALLSLGMLYVVCEWCQQSHLSTEHYPAACRGLARTRTYRRLTYPVRLAARAASCVIRSAARSRNKRSSLLWMPDPPRHHNDGGGGGTEGTAARLGVTPVVIQLERWPEEAHLLHRPVSRDPVEPDPLLAGECRRASPPYFLGSRGRSASASASASRSRSRSRGESDASTRALLLGGSSGEEAGTGVELLGVGAGLGVRPVYARQGTDEGGLEGRGEGEGSVSGGGGSWRGGERGGGGRG